MSHARAILSAATTMIPVRPVGRQDHPMGASVEPGTVPLTRPCPQTGRHLVMSTHSEQRPHGLRVLPSTPRPEPDAHQCSGYTCSHPDCQADRATAIKRGVRPSSGLPIKRAA